MENPWTLATFILMMYSVRILWVYCGFFFLENVGYLFELITITKKKKENYFLYLSAHIYLM